MRNLAIVLLFSLPIIFSAGVGAQEADSTRLYFVLGMLNDYMERTVSEGDSLIEAFYLGDMNDGNPAIFAKNLNLLLKDVSGADETGGTDTVLVEVTRFYSKRLAAAIDSCFVFDYSRPYGYRWANGPRIFRSSQLKPALIRSAMQNESYAFAFLRGVYLRNAISKGSQRRDPTMQTHLAFANSFYKAALTERLLRQFGCAEIQIRHAGNEGGHVRAPHVTDIFFTPSDAILSEVIVKAVNEYFSYPLAQ